MASLLNRCSLLTLVALSLAPLACVPRGDPAIDGVFTDDFNRVEVGPLWRNTGGPFQIVDGKLKVRGARNKPLWLKRTLPHDVRVPTVPERPGRGEEHPEADRGRPGHCSAEAPA